MEFTHVVSCRIGVLWTLEDEHGSLEVRKEVVRKMNDFKKVNKKGNPILDEIVKQFKQGKTEGLIGKSKMWYMGSVKGNTFTVFQANIILLTCGKYIRKSMRMVEVVVR